MVRRTGQPPHADGRFDSATPPYCGVVPGRRFDAVLLDIDHAPDQVLAPSHTGFYTDAGLQRLARFLQPDGLFALWSNDPPSPDFLSVLTRVFGHAEGHLISFDNPFQKTTSSNGLYLAGRRAWRMPP